jgi:hypothetical protein
LGKDSLKKVLDNLIVEVENGNYQKASELLSGLPELLPSLSPAQARELYLLLDSLQKKLKLNEEELLKQLSNSKKVKESYGKCSL